MISRALELIRNRERTIVLIVLMTAAMVRLPVMLRNPIPAGDGVASNLEVAVNLAEGKGFSTMRKWTLYDDSMDTFRPEGNRQPAMAVLLLAVFLITGPSFFWAQCLSLAIGISCLLVCWIWVRRIFGRLPALFSLLVLSFTPLFLWYSVQPDSLLLFTTLFFLVLIMADRKDVSMGRCVLIGALTGISYLVRTQGMILAFSVIIWLLVRPGTRKIAGAAVFAAAFLLVCSPWLIRNQQAFGSPTYTQGSQFLLNENHWAAWEVRDTPPGPMDMIRNRGPAAVAEFVARGFLRVLEPVTTGSLHRGEIFGQPSLLGFALLALLALRDPVVRKRMFLPALAACLPMMLLVLHEHSGRYLAFFIVMVVGLGSSGLAELKRMTGNATCAVASVILVMPLIAPVLSVLRTSSVERAEEAMEVSEWLKENSDSDDWVVTFPNVELFVWKYRRPTLTMPNDYEMLLWPCLESHNVRYVVIDVYLPGLRPHLAGRWAVSADGKEWRTVDPPPFLQEVYRSDSGRTIVYRMSGDVPDGFMSVDSLPRDNARALPPTGSPW